MLGWSDTRRDGGIGEGQGGHGQPDHGNAMGCCNVSCCYFESDRKETLEEFGAEKWSRGLTKSDLYLNNIFDLLGIH